MTAPTTLSRNDDAAVADRLPHARSCARSRVRRVTAVLLGIGAITLTACGGGSAPTDNTPVGPPAVTSVTVTPASNPLQGVGATATLSASLLPSGATGTITWHSDNATIASVSGSGASAVVTAVAAGTTNITASAGSVTGSATVTVTPIVRSVVPSRTTAPVIVGGTVAITATVNADAGASTAVTWTSSAANIATVDANGTVTGVAPGASTITVTSTAFPSINATIAVTVAYPVVRSVTLAPEAAALLTGATRQLTPTVDADAGTSTAVTYISSTPAVATVSASGLVSAVTPGGTTITATSTANPTVSGTATITVTAPTLRAITISPLLPSVQTGATTQFALTFDADAGASTAVTWTSSNSTVATVSATGLVTALAGGTTTVKATSTLVPAVFAQTTLTVTAPPGLTFWQQPTITPPPTSFTTFVQRLWSVNASLAFGVSGSNLDASVLVWNGTRWTLQAIAPFTSIRAITGTSTEVLIGNNTGRIARYTITGNPTPSFTEMTVPSVACIGRIVNAGATEAVAVGYPQQCSNGRAILVYSGGTWTRIPDPPLGSVTSIAAQSSTNIVASGDAAPSVARWNGTTWTALNPPDLGATSQVEMIGNDVVYTGGSDGYRLTGATWTPIPGVPREPGSAFFVSFLNSLTSCGGQVYVATTDSRVHRLNGTSWVQIAAAGAAAPGGNISLACGNDGVLRAGGPDGAIARYTGSAWIMETISAPHTQVSVVRPDLAYAVGNAVVHRWNGTSWAQDFAIGFGNISDVSAASDGSVFIAESFSQTTGAWRRTSGGTWTFDATDLLPSKVWANSATFALALAQTYAARFDGSGWQTLAPPPDGFVPNKMDGVGTTFAIAVGSNTGAASALKWNGTTWSTMSVPGALASLTSVDVVSPTLAYALSSTNTLLKWDGTQWTAFTAPPANAGELPLRSVAASSATDVYVLTGTGTLFRFDGTTWTRANTFPAIPGFTTNAYNAISVVSGFGVVTGAAGVIYNATGTAAFRRSK